MLTPDHPPPAELTGNDNLREFALCYSRHPGDRRGESRV